MNSMMTVSTQTKRMVGLVAVVATVFTLGGTLTLAENYSRSSTDGRGYLVATHHIAPAADLRKAS
ncbi:MAG: hypothetical protein WCV99_00625 [Sterolibacterium sp.]|jgi:hypothetical protein